MLGEYGTAPDPRQAAWLQGIPGALETLPQLKAVEYFDSGSWARFDPRHSVKRRLRDRRHDHYLNVRR